MRITPSSAPPHVIRTMSFRRAMLVVVISCRRQRGEMSLKFLQEPSRSLTLRISPIKELGPAGNEPIQCRHILARHRHQRRIDGDIGGGHSFVGVALPEWPLILKVKKQIGSNTAHFSQADI